MYENNTPVTMSAPSSQLEEQDGAHLDILPSPSEIAIFSMPEILGVESLENLDRGMAALKQLDAVLQQRAMARDAMPEVVDITGLDSVNRQLVDQVFGEGEVSMVYHSSHNHALVQESVMAGLWRVSYFDDAGKQISDTVEVACVPRICQRHVFKHAAHRINTNLDSIPYGVMNALPLLAEINDKVAEYRPGTDTHITNLTLLPLTEQDLQFLMERLGEGPLVMLSRGSSNCRITSTGVENVWWVEYLNSQDKNILNTLEIGSIPSVVVAAYEDIRESAERLSKIMNTHK